MLRQSLLVIFLTLLFNKIEQREKTSMSYTNIKNTNTYKLIFWRSSVDMEWFF